MQQALNSVSFTTGNSCSDCHTEKKNCHLAALHPNQKVSEGTENKAIATCPACGSTTPKGYLAQEAQAGRMGHRLYLRHLPGHLA